MINFQNSSSAIIEQILSFHDLMNVVVLSIAVATCGRLLIVTANRFRNRLLEQSQKAELLWTIAPAIILLFIAMPSLRLLYVFDECSTCGSTVKALGHQWYWQYDYPGIESYNSFLTSGTPYRLLHADNRLWIRTSTPTQIMITASDVLHSWTIPTIGTKADAIPGRVNKLMVMPKRVGVFFGQCSEICGRNHRFMPISLERF